MDAEEVDPKSPPEKPKAANPSVDQFNSLLSGVKDYNRQFSMGAMMAKALEAQVQSNDIVSEPEDVLAAIADGSVADGLKTKDETAQEMQTSVMDFAHQDALDALGLGLHPVSGEGARLFADNTTIGEGKMRLEIRDQQKFLGFLQGLDAKDGLPEELSGNLEQMAAILAQQIRSADLTDPSDETLRLLSSVGQISAEMQRLGIDGSKTLATYHEHIQQKNLKEFLEIEKGALLAEPGQGFGPADWQRDANPDYLRKNWTAALETLRKTRENPNAQAMYSELFDKLNNALKISRADLEQNPKYKEAYKSGLLTVLDEVQTQFG